MSQGVASLHKILKDETRQKIITLLSVKGRLSYSELMEELGVVSTGLLNYHLKVLGELLEKDQAEKYVLSEKGKLAYRVLTEFPNGQPQVDKRIYKSWVVLFVATIAITMLNGYFSVISWQGTILALIIEILSFAFAFYIRIRPSHTGNRAFFIAVGTFCLGFVFWALITMLILHSGLRWQIQSATGNLGGRLCCSSNFDYLLDFGRMGRRFDRQKKKLHNSDVTSIS
jgi:DNA-binding transcriptional ArsR family regulator